VTLSCPLCQEEGGLLLVRRERWRIIRATTGPEADDFPAFYRVVWNAHVAEWTDLSVAERGEMMEVVASVEAALRRHLRPTKVNLASLGNVVPHLHWHVVARFDWDSHFPAPLWASPARASDPERLAALRERLPICDAEVAALGA
jgi:diadenosine tetraphosphate (Ap4A) HIT family hydrolase